MKWKHRLGLSFMLMVIYSQLTWLMPETFTDLQRGVLHIGFMIGYALWLISDGKD